MRNQITAVLLVVGLVMGIGCQQQRKPKASSAKLNMIHFDFDKSDIKQEFKQTLQDNAAWLKQNKDAKIVVAGACDERGTEEYNIALGQRRANAGKNYLVSLGIDAKRMTTKSWGKEKPLETCHNESCWWMNRRDEFMKQ
jgi:peptidoglycan-associated lipoprotein